VAWGALGATWIDQPVPGQKVGARKEKDVTSLRGVKTLPKTGRIGKKQRQTRQDKKGEATSRVRKKPTTHAVEKKTAHVFEKRRTPGKSCGWERNNRSRKTTGTPSRSRAPSCTYASHQKTQREGKTRGGTGTHGWVRKKVRE